MARSHGDAFKKLRKEVSVAAQEARGPDKYVVGAIGHLLHGVELLNEEIQEVGKAVNQFEDQVTKFAKASDKVSLVMICLAIAQVFLAVVQVIVAAPDLLNWLGRFQI